MWIVTQFMIMLGTIAFGIWMYCIVTELENVVKELRKMRELQEKQDVRDR